MFTSYTATTFVETDPDRVFEYLRVPENQPTWAINFVHSTRPLSDGRYAMQTPAGELIYRIEEDTGCRTVDFVYETPEGETTMILPTRVVPHGRGSVFTFTIHRQPGMGDIEWEEGQRGLDEELMELRASVIADGPSRGSRGARRSHEHRSLSARRELDP